MSAVDAPTDVAPATAAAGAPAPVRAHHDRRWRARAALAVAEGTRLVRHPAFLAGLAIAALLERQALTAPPDWPGEDHYLAFVAWFPLFTGTVVAAGLAAGRGRLVHDVELFAGTPVTRHERVLAVAAGLALPAAVAGLAVAVAATVVARRGGFEHGDAPFADRVLPPLSEWSQVPLLVVLAGVVGIAAVQLPRGRLPALLAATAATLLGTVATWVAGASWPRTFHPLLLVPREHPLDRTAVARWSVGDAPIVAPSRHTSSFREVRFDVASSGWHLAYLAGLTLVVLCVAASLAGGRARRAVTATAVALLVVGGAAQALLVGTA